MKNTFFLLGLFSCFFCFSCKQTSPAIPAEQTTAAYQYEHPIPYAPEQYVCYRTPKTLTIDGKMTEAAWGKAKWTNDFVDIEGTLKPLPSLKTQVKMLWDDDYFYVYAKMEEPHIWGKLRQRDTVIFYDDDFEVFIDPDGDSHNYYELEVNALNTLWELILLRPYRTDNGPKVLDNWNLFDIKTAVQLEGSLNDPGDKDQSWQVEMAIPMDALKELAKGGIPKDGDQWRVNFSRVDWTMSHEKGHYSKVTNADTGKPLPESNWVWSPTGRINMHMPETWGYVQFSTRVVGAKEIAFVRQEDESIKWALWNLYFQQLAHFEKHGSYSDQLSLFQIPETSLENCVFQPQIYTTPSYFEIIASSCTTDGQWRIRKDGKIDLISLKK